MEGRQIRRTKDSSPKCKVPYLQRDANIHQVSSVGFCTTASLCETNLRRKRNPSAVLRVIIISHRHLQLRPEVEDILFFKTSISFPTTA